MHRHASVCVCTHASNKSSTHQKESKQRVSLLACLASTAKKDREEAFSSPPLVGEGSAFSFDRPAASKHLDWRAVLSLFVLFVEKQLIDKMG